MIKFLFFFSLLAIISNVRCQSYAPAAGQIGSKAIYKDSSIISAWANSCTVFRGPKQIDHPEYGLASYGNDMDGAGPAEGNSLNIVSLGDGGIAVLTFNTPITNGIGPDFAVFENGFADNYMEFAFVEVSSNGLDYYRFPAVSETPLVPQMTNGSYGDCRYINNLAGKYRQGYGTPFDLEELDSVQNLNINSITHIRLIDVVGSTDPNWGTSDYLGNLINDPWPTNFESSGFDLDAIAVLNPAILDLKNLEMSLNIFPNPFVNELNVNSKGLIEIEILTIRGVPVYKGEIIGNHTINTYELASGTYLLLLKDKDKQYRLKIIKY